MAPDCRASGDGCLKGGVTLIDIDKNFNIRMTRGDTFYRTLTLTKNGQRYTPDPSDVIRFAMSRVYKGKSGYELILEKVIPNDTLAWIIEASDTADLPYGKYVYDLQITYGATGYVETFADRKTLTLTEEVE